MPSPYPNNAKRSSESSKKESSSWFASWFENDNSNLKQEIHHKLNEFDDYQRRYERHNPFFTGSGAANRVAGRGHQPTTSSIQQEMEEFFESAGLGGLASPPPQWTSSSSSSSSSSFRGQGGHYQMMRKENQNGVQIDVQFPRAINAETVAVEVLQESPCVVQWRNASPKEGGREFRDRARLGEAIDCSKLSASISSSQDTLTVKAPRYSSSTASGQPKPRLVPVTEKEE